MEEVKRFYIYFYSNSASSSKPFIERVNNFQRGTL